MPSTVSSVGFPLPLVSTEWEMSHRLHLRSVSPSTSQDLPPRSKPLSLSFNHLHEIPREGTCVPWWCLQWPLLAVFPTAYCLCILETPDNHGILKQWWLCGIEHKILISHSTQLSNLCVPVKSIVILQLTPALRFGTFGQVSVEYMLSLLLSYTLNMLRNDDGKYENALFPVSKSLCF